MSKFQDNLRTYREQQGINAKEFAAKIGVKYTTYINYETQGREPRYDILIRIAAALHVSIDDLLGYEADKIGYWENYLEDIGIFLFSHGIQTTLVILDDNKSELHKQGRAVEASLLADFTQQEIFEVILKAEKETAAMIEDTKKDIMKTRLAIAVINKESEGNNTTQSIKIKGGKVIESIVKDVTQCKRFHTKKGPAE